MKLIKFKLTFKKTKMLSLKLVYSSTVHFSTVRRMSVHEINEIQINVQKSKKSYHQNSSTVLQFSSV